MRDVWEPVGPLPAAVYWRRRAVAVAGVVTLLVWAGSAFTASPPAPTRAALTAVSSGAPGPASAAPPAGTPADLAALTGPGGSTDPAGPPASGAPASPAAPADPAAPAASGLLVGPGAPADPAVSGAAGPTVLGPPDPAAPGPSDPTALAPSAPAPVVPGAPAGVPTTTSERIRPDDTPRPSPAAAPAPVPPTGPVPCTNAMITVAAEIDRPEHRVGERPVLRLVVTNASTQPCVRDLDSARQEVVVWSADLSTRLWSSNDCVNAPSDDLRTLVPGRPVAFAVTWAGRTSTPGCPQPRTVVPAGSYQVMTRVDDAISAPTPFVRTSP